MSSEVLLPPSSRTAPLQEGTPPGSRRNWLLINASMQPGDTVHLYPLGMSYISAQLKAHGYTVHCLDLGFLDPGRLGAELQEMIRAGRIGAVGIGGLSKDYNRVRTVIDFVRKVDPGIPIVLGGGMVSAGPDLIMSTLRADAAVLGEGDEAIVELARALDGGSDPAGVRGIAYRDAGGAVHRTPARPEVADLDTLPFPDHAGFGLERYIDWDSPTFNYGMSTCLNRPRVLPLLLSRSCTHRCTFCFHAVSKYRTRSLDNVFAELDQALGRYDINCLTIYDDLFGVKRSRLAEFCARVKPLKLSWYCSVRVEVVDREILGMLQDAGCFLVGYGFESMSRTVLKSMRKGITPPLIENAARLTYDNKMFLAANFIFGDPAETPDTANDTLNWWARNRKYRISTAAISAYPGTPIYQNTVARRAIPDEEAYLRQDCPQVNTTTWNDADYRYHMQQIGVLNHAMTLPGTLSGLHADPAAPGRYVYSARCPHCGETMSYDNMPLQHSFPVSCRLCRARYDLPVSQVLGRRMYPQAGTHALEQAMARFGAGDLDGAAGLAQAALAAAPHDWGALLLLGTVLLHTGQTDAAGNVLRVALVYNPNSAALHNNFGIYHFVQGFAGWALLHFRQALLLEADHPQARHNEELALEKLAITSDDKVPYVVPRSGQTYPLAEMKVAPPVLANGPVAVWPPLRMAAQLSPVLVH